MLSTTTWNVEIHIFSGEEHTSARATLVSGSGANRRHTLTGTGRTHRDAGDVDVPEIGDELAVSRALADLAAQLAATASSDIDAVAQR